MRCSALVAWLVGCSGPPPAELCVVRHAEAYKNLEPTPDLPPAELDRLTERGHAQARATGTELGPRVTRIATSPAGRAQQTASSLGIDAPIEVLPALRPLDGELAWSARESAWARGEDPRPPGGESLADGEARVRALLDGLRVGPGERVVWVTHGDIASLALGELRGTPLLERPALDRLASGQAACTRVSAR